MKIAFKKVVLRVVVASLSCVAGAAVSYTALTIYMPRTQQTVQSAKGVSAPAPKADTSPQLTFAAMGDLLAHDSIRTQAQKGSSYDFAPYFTSITPLYETRDVVFCNPETLASGDAFGISGYPSFNAPTEFARDLREKAHCNVINLATNHMNDKGQAAIDATVKTWEDLKPLAMAGANRTVAERDTVRYFTKNGIKVAFLAFMDFSNSALTNDYGVETYHDTARVKAKLAEARKNADAVIVSAHWGTEDSNVVNEDQTTAAKMFADAGVDIVIGTGPHVLQKVGYVDGLDGHKTLVWYSIGNMLSSQLAVNELTGGIAGWTITKKDNKVTVAQPTLQPTYMSYDWSAADRAAEKLSTRSNLVLKPLASSSTEITKMFSAENLATRKQYVETTIGKGAGVAITY